ncbi:MAG: methyltransferase domain-containing protein [Desulfobacteraceae bacterium]|nr:MAG: methyltransferase domain-containing protein [Desulfobacteraceae bacterium]
MLKFLQLHTFYHQYIAELYRSNPGLVFESFNDQTAAALKDGYGAVHMFTPYLNAMGYRAQVIFGNCIYSQAKWLEEHHAALSNNRNWLHDIVRMQIETFQPDILYASDSVTFDSRFFDSVAFRPKLIMGWRGATVPSQTDWSSFDLILSHLTVFRERALLLGAKASEFFTPGFPVGFAGNVQDEPQRYDVVFTGQYSNEHRERNALLLALATEAEKNHGFSLGLFLYAPEETLPPLLQKYNQGARWGLDMYRALRAGKIVINAEADFAGGEGGNMRLFEATGVGSFLLTQHQHNIDSYFKPGVEIETFRDENEMIAKIHYYLMHEEERKAINLRGHDRCKKEYAIEKRVQELDALVKGMLEKKNNYAGGAKHARAGSIDASGSAAGQTHSDLPHLIKGDKTAVRAILRSPLTGSSDLRLIRTIRTNEIISRYRLQFNIDVSKYISCPEISLYECSSTGYRFFYPFGMEGDSCFYQQLEKQPWYYADWKWEHESACRYLQPGHKVLEIGCAKGAFLEEIRSRSAHGTGLELNQHAIDAAKAKHLNVYCESIDAHALAHSREYDLVCAFQVIEHFSCIRTFLESALALLKPHGRLIISVPNHRSFMGTDPWNILDMPPHHMGHWDEESLKCLDKCFNLQLLKIVNEPLQASHYDYYADMLRKAFPADTDLQQAILTYAKNQPDMIKGFTSVAVFEKTEAGTTPILMSPAGTFSKKPLPDLLSGSAPVRSDYKESVLAVKSSHWSEALKLLTEELNRNPDHPQAGLLLTFIQSPNTGSLPHPRSKPGSKALIHKQDNLNEPRHPALLNLGCGAHWNPLWVNVDFKSNHPNVIAHDLNRSIPFSDDSFDAVYHSHLLEHLPKNRAPVFITECYRVLKPDGILRVVVPDLEQIARWYLLLLEKALQGDPQAMERYEWIMLEMFDQMIRNRSGGEMLSYWRRNPMPAESFVIERMGAEVQGMLHRLRRQPVNSNSSSLENRSSEQIDRFRLSGEIHQWMYDRYSLGKLLGEAGFSEIKVCRADESQIPCFNDFHLDQLPDGAVRKPDSLFMEARKPRA